MAWPSGTELDLVKVDNALKSEKLAIHEAYLIGTFAEKEGYLVHEGHKFHRKVRLFEGGLRQAGLATLKVTDFKSGKPYYSAVQHEMITPKVYQPK